MLCGVLTVDTYPLYAFKNRMQAITLDIHMKSFQNLWFFVGNIKIFELQFILAEFVLSHSSRFESEIAGCIFRTFAMFRRFGSFFFLLHFRDLLKYKSDWGLAFIFLIPNSTDHWLKQNEIPIHVSFPQQFGACFVRNKIPHLTVTSQ